MSFCAPHGRAVRFLWLRVRTARGMLPRSPLRGVRTPWSRTCPEIWPLQKICPQTQLDCTILVPRGAGGHPKGSPAWGQRGGGVPGEKPCALHGTLINWAASLQRCSAMLGVARPSTGVHLVASMNFHRNLPKYPGVGCPHRSVVGVSPVKV